jgi:hypothetical protein
MSKELILKIFEEHKGEFVITAADKVMRLIGVGDDGYDYCWVFWDGRDTCWHSCVGSFIVLKNKIDENDYNNLIRMAKLNHYDQADMYHPKTEEHIKINLIMVERVKQEFSTPKEEGSEYITELCWKIN